MRKTTLVVALGLGSMLGLSTLSHAAPGDVNGDGGVTIADGVQILRAAAGVASACTLEACDVDTSGAITVTDGAATLRRSAGLAEAATAGATLGVAPVGVPVHFVLDSDAGLEGFHVEVTYPLAKGGFVGSADGVACSSDGGGFFVANDRDDGTMALLQASAVALDFPIVVTCLYEPAAGETLAVADLGLGVVEVVLNGASADPSLLATTIAVGELPVCSTGRVRLASNAGGVLDPGWTGLAHGSSLPRDATLDLPLDCAAASSTCSVDGPATVGARVGAPLAISAGGVSVCVLNSVRAAVSGTFDCESGCADLTVPLRSEVHLVVDPTQPCPPCVGDPTPNDGIPAGTCSDGATPGAPCDAGGTNDLFQDAGGAPPDAGRSSWDCRPSFSAVGVLDVDLNPLTTGGAAATASVDCASDFFPPGACHCPGQVQANGCIPDGVCPASGFCENNPPDGVCSGQRYRSCILSNPPESDCEDIIPGAGTCVAQPRPCFGAEIERTGACGLDDGVLASAFCIPATNAPAVNTVFGLPGPGALTVPFHAVAAAAPTATVPGPSPGPTGDPTPVATATPFGCASSPQGECRGIVHPNKASLTLEEGRTGINQLAWRWLGGEDTPSFTFGFPPFFTEYALCAYSGAPESTLVLGSRVGPDFSCRKLGGCWRHTAKGGWVYNNPRANADGVTHVELAPGPNGAARVVFKARSALLDLPSLPLIPPLTVQLQSNEGQCWETRFAPDDVLKNDGRRFRAKARP